MESNRIEDGLKKIAIGLVVTTIGGLGINAMVETADAQVVFGGAKLQKIDGIGEDAGKKFNTVGANSHNAKVLSPADIPEDVLKALLQNSDQKSYVMGASVNFNAQPPRAKNVGKDKFIFSSKFLGKNAQDINGVEKLIDGFGNTTPASNKKESCRSQAVQRAIVSSADLKAKKEGNAIVPLGDGRIQVDNVGAIAVQTKEKARAFTTFLRNGGTKNCYVESDGSVRSVDKEYTLWLTQNNVGVDNIKTPLVNEQKTVWNLVSNYCGNITVLGTVVKPGEVQPPSIAIEKVVAAPNATTTTTSSTTTTEGTTTTAAPKIAPYVIPVATKLPEVLPTAPPAPTTKVIVSIPESSIPSTTITFNTTPKRPVTLPTAPPAETDPATSAATTTIEAATTTTTTKAAVVTAPPTTGAPQPTSPNTTTAPVTTAVSTPPSTIKDTSGIK